MKNPAGTEGTADGRGWIQILCGGMGERFRNIRVIRCSTANFFADLGSGGEMPLGLGSGRETSILAL